MEYSWLLYAALFAVATRPGGTRPVISPSQPQLVVPVNAALTLICHDDSNVRWKRGDSPSRKVQGEEARGSTSTIKIPRAEDRHTGRYICENEKTREESSIYVFVRDPEKIFVVPVLTDVLTAVGSDCTIPCLATDPGVVDLRLERCSGDALPVGLEYTASIERGMTIRDTQAEFQDCYVCTARLDGAVVKSRPYTLTVRPVPQQPPIVSVSEREVMILTVGQRLQLTCSTTNVNINFVLQWSFPPGTQPTVRNKAHILKSSTGYEKSSVLEIAVVKKEDAGTYECKASNEKGVTTASVQLKVYERGFIRATEVESGNVQVRAGESITLRVELEAYPKLQALSWIYLGHELCNSTEHLITTHTVGYRYSSELKLVRLKVSEGGIYTFFASNADASINQSFAIHVISKPEIVVHEGPLDGQVRCIAEGYPAPEISWFYCDQTRVRCSRMLNATQEVQGVTTVVLSSPDFGKRRVESRLNISRGNFRALECLATVEEAQAFSLFSLREHTVPHQLFTPLLIGFVTAAAALCLISIVLFYKYLKKPKYQIQWKVIEGIHGNNYVYIDPTQLPYDHQWEFPRDKLRFGKTLGSGAFGKVVEATAYGMSKADTVMTVAVKMLKPSAHATEKEALMSELKVLSYLGHHMNIVNLLGACTVGGPTLVITEYCCFGDLLNFLRRKREMFFCSKLGDDCYYKNVLLHQETSDDNRSGYMAMKPSFARGPPHSFSSERRRSLRKDHSAGSCGDKDLLAEMLHEDSMSLDTEDLLSVSYQVAKGMDFLASKNCIHRDLAARNILLTRGRVAKICDFGLARDITTDSNYVVKGNARLPVKWMSPESIFECVYTFESDVWSYGILLWEIFSLGSSPYPGMPVDSKFYKMIKEGYRMNEPEFAPSKMYEVMKSCWDADPFRRPSFGKIVDKIEQQLSDSTKHIYLNFSSRFTSRDENIPFLRLNSVGSSTASMQPLLVTDDVFLEEGPENPLRPA